ncbi:MAG: serine/threonine protein kinase [Mesorhizobium sp.]|uniref:serine/threonine-protein kinase n=2 Tax=Mesorhizobium sp. TaxID=1871066 RepID=UPI000FE75479|nr:serine/threonine-protein kinase [Mesorhizobium sp.]RWB87777.1 MAG: serine/threonine protein kinase [Mesorhizobium sp.]
MSDDDRTRISGGPPNTGVGTQLSGIYELDERIASGGMGEVYRGHNIQTGDHVAIKIVLPEFARDQTILSLFRKEASILNHLSHDAVVRYHVFTVDAGIGRPYLAMEFVDGQSLFDVLRRGPMPAEDVRRLCHRLASGLSAVHQAGAIHRDLSPDNIILPGGRVERAKIVDFGIARSATVGGETLIGGRFAGKYNYVSPEQLGLYGGEVSEQSDIYSLGLVLAAALRGKPIDMSGSQYEVIEKRRSVPDLSDIDPHFRDLIDAMLQPDPRDRPASMAEIARATRGEDDDATLPPPASFGSRERSGLPRAGWTAAPQSNVHPQPSATSGEQPFVQHVRPAHLSESRPAAASPRAAKPAVTPQGKPSRTPILAIGSVVALAVVTAAGLYVSGVLGPSPPIVVKAPSPVPKPVPKPKAEKPKPQPETPSPDDTATNEPAKPAPPVQPQPDGGTPPASKQPTAVPDQEPKPPLPAETTKPRQPQPVEVQQPAQKAAPATQPQSVTGDEQTAAPPTIKPIPISPPARTPPPALQPDTVVTDHKGPASPPGKTAPAPPPIQKPAPPPAVQPEVVQNQKTTPPAGQPTEPEAPAPSLPKTPALPAQPPTAEPDKPDVAINLPKPTTPPPAKPAGELAERASWVRDYNGGNCFYATVTSAADRAAAIEGFGTAVQPFEQMLGDFQARFHLEPDISVRLITPSQCGVPTLLRFLGRSGAESPELVLDRTSVPDGSPISGTLITRAGLISNVLLINHSGIAFNLDDRMVPQPDKATFNIPIDLAAADKAAGKALPQVMLVITGPQDLQAAMFSGPTPASELLPKLLKEIQARGPGFSATAKYFQLGG